MNILAQTGKKEIMIFNRGHEKKEELRDTQV